MVVKINPPTANVSASLEYNERKVAEGKASVTFYSKIDDIKNPLETFERYERGSIRTEKLSFHASINPGPADKMSEKDIVNFAKELMSKLGYGDQPYILYKHNDIEREHYHIVSIRVDKKGRKIPDFKERKRCQEIMKELSSKYNYKIGNGNVRKSVSTPYQGFNRSLRNYSQQMESLVKFVMKYHFTSIKQFDQIMKSLNVEIVHTRKRNQEYMIMYGVDRKTHRRCTGPIDSRKLDICDIETIYKHSNRCKKILKPRERKRAANWGRIALKHATSELHLQRILAKQGINITLSKTVDGKIFGVTFIDHQTKCCLKASELKGISAKDFEFARLNEWEEDKVEKENTLEEIQDLALSVLGNEISRKNEDEQIMKRAKHKLKMY